MCVGYVQILPHLCKGLSAMRFGVCRSPGTHLPWVLRSDRIIQAVFYSFFSLMLLKDIKPGVVVHAYNPSTQEAEVGGS
jgi:hypothetical protein